MDILLSKLVHLVSLPALVIIPGSFWAALVTAIRLSRGRMPKTTAKRLFKLWLFVVIPWAVLLGGSALLLHISAWHRFNTIVAHKPSHLLISSEGKTNEISDRAVIDQFFQIATQSQNVMGHHSHAVSRVTLLFPQTGYMYSLGRDSQHTNEFWFDWSGIVGHGRDWLDVGASLGQLRSDELERWITKYAPPATAGPDTKVR